MKKKTTLFLLLCALALMFTGFDSPAPEPPARMAPSEVAFDNNEVTISCKNGTGCSYTLSYNAVSGTYQVSEGQGFSLLSLDPLLEVTVNTLLIGPLFTGKIIINGENGDDQLIVDYSGGNPIPEGGAEFNGGNDSGGEGDKLEVTGGPDIADKEVTYTGSDGTGFSGSLGLDGSTIAYTGLEPILFTGVAANVSITLPGGTDNPDATLQNNTSQGAGYIEFIGSTFEDIVFPNPTGTLAIYGGGMSDKVTIKDLDGPSQSYYLDIGGNNAIEQIAVEASNINLTGSNSISFTAVGGAGTFAGISLDAASISTASGGITLRGTGGSTGDGNRGVELINASSIATTGGAISITGTGGGNSSSNHVQGVVLTNSSTITSTGSGSPGAITIDGIAGGGVTQYQGVLYNDGSSITSVDADILITGQGGGINMSGSGNAGIASAALVESTGSGSITLDGTGGKSNGINLGAGGVNLFNGSIVRVNSGNIKIDARAGSGTGGGTGLRLTNTGGGGDILSSGGASSSIELTCIGSGWSSFRLVGSGNEVGGSGFSGKIVINTDDVEMTAGSIRSSGNLVIQPNTAGTKIGIGNSATGTLNLSTTALARLANGFNLITIGNASAGNVDINACTFNDNVEIIGADIDVVGLNAGTNDVELEASGVIKSSSSASTNVTAGMVTLTGDVAPGASPGIFSVSGGLIINGDLNMEITGAAPPGGTAGVEFDQLQVTGTPGTVNITGAVNVNFGSYTPSTNTSYPLITATGSITVGAFTTIPANINATFIGGMLMIGNTVFPVEMLYFRGGVADKAVHLEWATATELNNDFFELQRSTDLRSFGVIGKIAGAGTTQEEQKYAFTDHDPLPGLNYYRLRQVDFDGAFEYSNIISILSPSKTPGSITMAPNPASGQVELRLPAAISEDELEVFIHDATGRVVLQGPFQATGGRLQLSLNGLGAGQYTVLVRTGGREYSERLILH